MSVSARIFRKNFSPFFLRISYRSGFTSGQIKVKNCARCCRICAFSVVESVLTRNSEDRGTIIFLFKIDDSKFERLCDIFSKQGRFLGYPKEEFIYDSHWRIFLFFFYIDDQVRISSVILLPLLRVFSRLLMVTLSIGKIPVFLGYCSTMFDESETVRISVRCYRNDVRSVDVDRYNTGK